MTRYTFLLVYLISAINGQEFQYKYFGESPPGNSPKIFAEKIIDHAGTPHIIVAFHPNEKEIYWLPSNPAHGGLSEILFSVYENKKWSVPKTFEPSRGNDVLSLSISPDGNKLYFSSNKIWPNGWGEQPPPRQLGHFKIWYCEREQDSWGEAKLLDKNINDIGGVSESLTHALYTDGLKISEMSDGFHQAWERVHPNLDIGRSRGGHPFISPDESFVLFGKRRETFGSYIYISFRGSNNNWSEPVNLSKIMGIKTAASQPIISPDGKYLFYFSDENLFWISTNRIYEYVTSHYE